jgi:hypothetical protein
MAPFVWGEDSAGRTGMAVGAAGGATSTAPAATSPVGGPNIESNMCL